jgi:hypothetical protein
MQRSTLVSLLAGVSLLCACGGPKTVNLAPRPTEEVVEGIPQWLLKPPSDQEHLYAAASATSRDLQVALQKARINAQTDLAQQLSTRLANLSKQFQEETGLAEDSALLSQFSSATKAVTQQTLEGARVDQQQVAPEKEVYRAYVLMRLPLGQANHLLMSRLKANQELYTRFRATQAFDELDRELKSAVAGEGK